MAQVKICGITTPEALDAAADADWVGFNFVPASPRAIPPEAAAALSRSGPAAPARVGLFVDPSDEDVAAVLALLPLSALQIYAAPARAREIGERFGVPVWRALGVASRDDLPGDDGPLPARFLMDAAAPPNAAIPGGNARPFDWTLLQGWKAPAPWLLAGGLTPGNVQDAVAQSGATAVDVSSGVESRRGVKDPALVRAFIRAAKPPARP